MVTELDAADVPPVMVVVLPSAVPLTLPRQSARLW